MSRRFDRFKDRRLVQWALAYLAGAFVVVQVMDALAEPLGLGVVGQRGVVGLLVLGFLLALTLAWYHGEKGHQRASGTELAVLAAIVVLGGGVLVWLVRSVPAETPAAASSGGGVDAPAPLVRSVPIDPPATAASAGGIGTAARLGPASIAVLPLTSAAADAAETDFLVEGFHNAIQTQLTKIGALEVIGRATVARYASTEMTPNEIGHELGVANVLQGSVLRVADDLQLSVQLTEAATGRQLWAEAYERSLTVEQLFDILEDVASQIAGALEVALTPGDLDRGAAVPTDNVEAYEQYLRGENLWAEGVDLAAMEAYQRAVTLEPDFAVAWARLVEVASWLFFSNDNRLLHVATQALERATALAPGAAATRVARGAYLMYVELDYERAFDLFDSVLEGRPNDAEVITYQGRVRAFQGRWDEAERNLTRALALDPLLSKASENLGNVLRNHGRFSEAARYLDRAAELSPEDGATAFVRMHTYLWGLGDTTTVREFVDHGAPPLAGSRHNWRAHLAYLSRDADTLERLARDSTWAGAARRFVWLTRVALLRGDPEARAVYGDSLASLRAEALDQALAMDAVGDRDLIISWRRSYLGVALALAGDEEGALREARLAREQWPVEALDRDRVFRNIVLVHTFLGRSEAALDQLERELSLGNPQLTPWRLRVDPDFDVLREHSRFQALLERSSQP